MGFNIIDTPINHTSDAGFRAWAQELDAAFVAAGWVNTTDTGQVDLTTMLRPATNTVAGYKIYYYNDSLHGSAPIYMKVEYGTGAGATVPAWFVTSGAGSDGAGNLTGILSTRTVCNAIGVSPTSTVLNYRSYFTWGDGYFAVAWKAGAVSSGYGFLAVNRFTDSLGAPLSSGYAIYPRSTASTQQQCISYASGLSYSLNLAYSMVGGSVTNSLIGGVAQTYRHYAMTPRMQLNPFMLTVINAELTTGNVFQADVVGTGLIDWMPVGSVTQGTTVTGSSIYGFAIPWN